MTACIGTHAQIEQVVSETRSVGLRVEYDPDDSGTLEIWNGPYQIYWGLRKGDGADAWIVRYDPEFFEAGAS